MNKNSTDKQHKNRDYYNALRAFSGIGKDVYKVVDNDRLTFFQSVIEAIWMKAINGDIQMIKYLEECGAFEKGVKMINPP